MSSSSARTPSGRQTRHRQWILATATTAALTASLLTAPAAGAAAPAATAAPVLTAAAAAVPPVAPIGVTAEPREGFVTVAWTPVAADPGGAVITYQIGRTPVDATGVPTGAQVVVGVWRADRNEAGITTFADSGFPLGQSYSYQVRAVATTGTGGTAVVENGAWSSAAVVTTIGATGPVELRTGFEVSGGASWTTHTDELAFLSAVEAASTKVDVRTIGTTKQGRPIQLVVIGNNPEAPAADIAALSPSMLSCSVHGAEPASREGCLMMIRELAFSTDPATVDLLTKSAVIVIPSVNPDGRAVNSRGNSTGQDLNRDHSLLEQEETFAMAEVFRDYQPVTLVDGHEYGNNNTGDLPLLWPRNPNVDDGIHAAGESLVLDFMFDESDDAGWWPVPYPIGYAQETILRNTTGLKNIVGMLLESRVGAGPTRLGTNTTTNMQRRVYSHLWTYQELLKFHTANLDEIVELTDGAKQRQIESTDPIALNGARDVPTELPPAQATTTVLNPAPCGYLLTNEQLAVITEGSFATVAQKLEAHGIEVTPTAEGNLVLLAQPLRGLIPLLLDPAAEAPMIQGTALYANCTPTTTEVTATPEVLSSGNVTFTATVTGAGFGVPTGDVTFSIDEVEIGVATVENGVATLTVASTALPVGSSEVVATFGSESGFLGSVGTTYVVVGFPDVPLTNGFFGDIIWMVDAGLATGYSDGTFRPVAPVSRGAMAAFIYRMANDGATAPACTVAPFSDVGVGFQFCGEITWLKETGLSTGYTDGTYRPATNVSRQAMAAFLYRYATDAAPNPVCDPSLFTDVKNGHPFCGEITWLRSNDITTGTAGAFLPANDTSRQAMAAFLSRLSALS